ncbi:MAG TPA: helix-turn-helix domain-containing protein, partial [Anaerolineae bacterium]
MDDLLTTKQLMDLLHLDRTTIYRMLNDGRLPGVRVGGQWRFSRQTIDGWLKDQKPSVAESRGTAE